MFVGFEFFAKPAMFSESLCFDHQRGGQTEVIQRRRRQLRQRQRELTGHQFLQ